MTYLDHDDNDEPSRLGIALRRPLVQLHIGISVFVVTLLIAGVRVPVRELGIALIVTAVVTVAATLLVNLHAALRRPPVG